jgi:benzoyl-CoA reductase/2-hydroxyglutaryl-CoA dehydratase subunit BcrC/BadD/HgdB
VAWKLLSVSGVSDWMLALSEENAMSIRTFELIRARVKARPAELEAARASGAKVVGWLGYNIPEELIHALGLIPVRLGTGGDDRLVEVGSRWISTKNCVFTRQAVGLFAEQTDPYVRNSDVVAVDATCLQLFRLSEIIEYYFKAKTVVLGVPRNFYQPEGIEYFRHEVQGFAQELEAIAGQALSPDRLRASIALYDAIRATTAALYRHQAADDAVISWRQVYEVVQAGYYLDRAEYAGLLSDLLAEVEEKRLDAAYPKVPDGPRVFISGSVIPPGDNKLLDILESFGARIVGDDLWSGFAPAIGVDIVAPTLPDLADAYIKRLPHGALPYLDQASDRRIANLKALIREFRVRGVVYHSLRYCDAYTFKTVETKNILKAIGIPLLDIHTEYAGSDFEAIRTRAEAFLEMVREADLAQDELNQEEVTA